MIDLSKLSKEELLVHMEGLYDSAKPHQDALAQGSIEIIAGAKEVFGRIIAKHLPTVAYSRTKIVTRLSCTLNCLGNPSQELARRLNTFSSSDVKIVRVEYDESLHEYIFHAEPTGEKQTPTEV